MLTVYIKADKSDALNLEIGDYLYDLERTKKAIEAFTMNPENTITYSGLGGGYAELMINGKTNAVTPYGISITTMLQWCGIDKNSLATPEMAFFTKKQPTNPGTFSAPDILNFASMNVQLEYAIGNAEKNSDDYPYLGEKPGGTDVGHLIGYQGQTYIVKTGITLSLLGQAFGHVVEGKKEKADKKLGTFILGSYTRIAGIKDKVLIEQLKSQIITAFDNYLLSEHGQQLQAKVRGGHVLHTDDVYQIYLYLCTQNVVLKDVIGLPAFADVVSGCHSQQVNNVFQLTQNNRVAQHLLLMLPNDQTGIFQGSNLLDSRPFDKFLLEPFVKHPKSEHQTEEEWITQCQNELKENLKAISLKGLCSGILTRHVMGESADNGPDNMILSEQVVINIDLTGFRYPRKDQFGDVLGWADTLTLNTADGLLERLFHPSVFKDRFVKDLSLPENLKTSIYLAIVTELKASVEHVVVKEVVALRQWLASLNPDLVNQNLARATQQVYGNLPVQIQFSSAHLGTLIAFNQQFITQAIEVANTFEKTHALNSCAQASMS